MASVKTFSIYESKLNTLNFNVYPYKINFKVATIYIQKSSNGFLVSSDSDIMVNAEKTRRTKVHTYDLIRAGDEYAIFYENKSYKGRGLFIGKIRYQEGKLYIFKLPRKVSARPFSDLEKYLVENPEAIKLYVDTSSVQYMDSDSISQMIHLINHAKQHKISLFFYYPSYKFLTYLKLANIEKLVKLVLVSNKALDEFIRGRESNSNNLGESRFIITDNLKHSFINAESLISVGRLQNTCDICLTDERVSRFHALLINSNHFLYIIDCESTNYTYVNGWKIVPYKLNSLKVNDIIAFGQNIHYKVKQI